LADDLQIDLAETANQPISGHTWSAFNRWRGSENAPSIAVCGFSSKSLAPKAQSTLTPIDFLAVPNEADEAAPLQSPKDFEKKLRLRVRPSHQFLTDFGVPSPLRFVEDDDVFRRHRAVGMFFQIAEQVLNCRVGLILGRGFRLPRASG